MKNLILFYTLSLFILIQVAMAKASAADEITPVTVQESVEVSVIYHPDIADLLDPSYPRIA